MRGSKERTRRMMESMAVLLRNTTWKCGKIERMVVNYLSLQLQKCGRIAVPVREMLQHFKFRGKRKSEFLDAIQRLEKRRILKVRTL
ncbi:hypothetical protein J7L06_09815 [Candidatus Bathyarchaeota archaeon]|nr:hypothetical protein [Candidatus Bathyarchaeota archaeon]